MVNSVYRFIGVCMFLLPFQFSSFAETIKLEEIVVRGEREVGAEESLDIRDVRETPARDVGEALDKIEGLSFIRKGAIGNEIVLRGFQGNNVDVLIDGARLYGACPNHMDPTSFHVDFAEVEEISILKGPFDVTNAGSLGGLINIKTVQPKKGWHLSVNPFYGSYDDIRTAVNASYGNDTVDALLGYSYKYSLPYKDGDGDRITELYPLTSPNRYRPSEEDDKAYSMNTFWTTCGWNLLKNQRMEVSYTRQEADDVIYPYLLMDAVYDNTDRINWSYEASGVSRWLEKLKTQFYWNQVKHQMSDWRRVSSVGRPQGYSMLTYAETETYGGKMNASVPVGGGILVFGVDGYSRNWDADTTLMTGTQDSIPDVTMRDIGTFLDYTRPLAEKIDLTLGARFDSTRSEADNNRTDLYFLYHRTRDTDQTDSYGSGNIQISYTPISKVELFTGFGVGVRPPDPAELYLALARPMQNPNWVGNPNLDPEFNREGDVGIKYLGTVFHGKATFFFSDVKDYITVYNAPGPVKPARSYRNVDATLYGYEASMNMLLPFHLVLQGGLSYTHGRDDTFDKPLSEIPPLKGRIALRYDADMYFAEIEGMFANEQDRVDHSLNEEKTPGWGVMNLKCGAAYKKLQFFAGIQNVLDKQYVETLSYQRDPFRSGIKVPEIGRSFYINMAYAF